MQFGSLLKDHKQSLFCSARRAYNKIKREKRRKCCETSIVKWLSYTLNCPPSNGQQESQAQSIPNLGNSFPNLPSRTLGKLSFFQSLLEDLREHHGLLKATPPLQSGLVLKHIFFWEVKLNFCKMSDIAN